MTRAYEEAAADTSLCIVTYVRLTKVYLEIRFWCQSAHQRDAAVLLTPLSVAPPNKRIFLH